MSESKTLVITGVPIAVKVPPFAPTIRATTPLWWYWAQIAVENEHVALLHRQAAELSNQGAPMINETKASMVTLTAAAHALDAFCNQFADVSVTDEVRARWRKNRTSRATVILESLKMAFGVNGNAWSKDLRWLFLERRNRAIHYRERAQEVVKHPLGMSTAPELVDYSAEACTRAVDLLCDVIETCTSSQNADWRVAQLHDLRVTLQHERES